VRPARGWANPQGRAQRGLPRSAAVPAMPPGRQVPPRARREVVAKLQDPCPDAGQTALLSRPTARGVSPFGKLACPHLHPLWNPHESRFHLHHRLDSRGQRPCCSCRARPGQGPAAQLHRHAFCGAGLDRSAGQLQPRPRQLHPRGQDAGLDDRSADERVCLWLQPWRHHRSTLWSDRLRRHRLQRDRTAASIDVQVQGDKLRAVLPASLLPSLGLAPQDYTWALWAVDLAVTGLPRNADFISADNLNVTAVPEPSSLALMLAGMAAVGGVVRSRRSR
jgi:hypothetical protein